MLYINWDQMCGRLTVRPLGGERLTVRIYRPMKKTIFFQKHLMFSK